MKNAKKITLAILTIAVLLSALLCTGITSFAATSGDYEYTVLDDGTAEIIGYSGSATNLTIPSKLGGYTVTSIGDQAFQSCTNLTEVKIPNSVKNIGAWAFEECTALKTVTISNQITKIEMFTFWGCKSLSKVTIPNSVKTIEYQAFAECSNLKTVIIPTSIKTIEYMSFLHSPIKNVYYAGSKAQWNKITNYDEDKLNEATIHYNYNPNSASSLATPKLSSVENTATGVKISWGKVTGAEKYRVYYKVSGGSWTKIADTTSTSYTWKSAKSGTKYTFTVKCVSSDGKTATSSYDSTGKSITYIAAPKLSSVENTASGVKITWAKSTGAAKYRVYYKVSGGSWTKIADTTSTSYTWKGAKSGTKYTFTVRCLNSGATAFTSSYNSTGKSITYIAAPKLSSLEVNNSGVKISWAKSTGAAKYRVYYKSANGWTKIADTTSTSYTWKGAKSGTKYTFTVRCINSGATAFTSSYDSTGKSITVLSTPKLSSVTKSSSGITIKWGTVTGAAKYRVYYKTAGGSWTKIADTTSTSYTWTGGKTGTKYTFTVRCINSNATAFTSGFDATGKSITK